MSAPAIVPTSDDRKPWQSSPTPDVTVAQGLAFGAFVLFGALAAFGERSVTAEESADLKKLCIFLIAALLPSDALVRFGRSRFMATRDAPPPAGQDEEQGAQQTLASAFPARMPRTTLGQLLAAATFGVVCGVALCHNSSGPQFGEVAETASYLIAALLPSEATVRFARSLWLRQVPTAQVTDKALKKI